MEQLRVTDQGASYYVSNPYAPPDPNKPRTAPPRQPLVQRRGSGTPPPAPDPTPEQLREVNRGVMRYGLLMVLALMGGLLPIPWQAIGPIAGLVALVSGGKLLVRVLQLRWRGMLAPLLVGGLLLTALTTMASMTQLALFWDEQSAYQDCREQAITIAAQDRCLADYQDAITPVSTD